ncbi:nad -binding protein [Colletotrichum incanum]|uniref:Nad-binding protein n=1 Tax=Colletotrichum incanum TaxID=1573173 RepID=A0A166QCY9_COLIC|nr:nad -binding protein [Colletotrichum incanum]
MTISTEPSAPLIVVVGATGLQGDSVINNLAASAKPYRMRGLTRDPMKPTSKALAERGVKIVACNLSVENVAGIEDAFRNATYVFVFKIVTNFWEHFDQGRETAEGKVMVTSAKKAGVKLLLLSTEPNATKASGGKITKLYHFDSKAFIADHAREIGVPFVEIEAAGHTLLKMGPTFVKGAWAPDTKMPLIDTYHDFGRFSQWAIESEEFNKGGGKVIFAYAEWMDMAKQTQVLSQVTGKDISYQQITEEESRSLMANAAMPPHVIDDMIDLFRFHEQAWEATYVHNNRKNLARQPRTFKEYCQTEDWSYVMG